VVFAGSKLGDLYGNMAIIEVDRKRGEEYKQGKVKMTWRKNAGTNPGLE